MPEREKEDFFDIKLVLKRTLAHRTTDKDFVSWGE